MEALTDDIVFGMTTFLNPYDLVKFSSTCKRFGGRPPRVAKGRKARKRRKAGRAAEANDPGEGSARQWSLAEEAARRIVREAERDDARGNTNLLRRQGVESWTAVHRRSHQLRTALAFHRFVGNGIRHKRRDPSHIEGKMKRRHVDEIVVDEGLRVTRPTAANSYAIFQEIMTAGRHYAEFTVTCGGKISLGILRPAEGWDTSGIETIRIGDDHGIHQNDRGYSNFCRRQSGPGYQGGVDHYFLNAYLLKDSDVVGLLLDLENGTLNVYHNGTCLGTGQEGLAGYYCWAVFIGSWYKKWKPGIKISRAPFPAEES